MLREAALHSEKNQAWLGRWWSGLLPDEKRTLLAFAGLDDTLEFARRPWGQLMQEQRDTLLLECRRLHRLVSAVAWS